MKDYKEIIEVLIFLSALVFPAIGLPVTDHVKAMIAVGISIAFILFKTVELVYKKYIENRSMTKVKTMGMTSRYVKTIKKFSDAIDKKISKRKDFDEVAKLKELEKDVLFKLNNPDKVTNHKLKLQDKLKDINLKFNNHEIKKLILESSKDKDYILAHYMSDFLVNLDRTLLNAEQYQYRIKFGEFISKYTLSEESHQRALIDSIGWTNLMIGHLEKGEKAIFAGINRALNVVKETSIDKLKHESYYNLARAYRHLGSNRYTGENYPEKAMEYFIKAEEYYNLINPLSLVDKNKTQEMVDKQMLEMKIGIDYGKIISTFLLFKQRLQKQTITQNEFSEFIRMYELLKEIKTKTVNLSNKHRYVKVEILLSKFTDLLHEHYEQFSLLFKDQKLPLKDDLIELFKSRLNDAEKVFKQNIYMDEAVENYLEQKVIEMKYNIIQTLSGGN